MRDTQRSDATFITTDKHKDIEAEAKENSNIRGPPPIEQYDFNVQLGDGLPDEASFFRKVTHRLMILIAVATNPILIFLRLLNTGVCPNLIPKDFLPKVWMDFIKSTKTGSWERQVVKS